MAASVLSKSRTEVVLNAVGREAEQVLLDQRLFELDEERFNAFINAMEKSVAVNERLHALLDRKSPWEQRYLNCWFSSILSRTFIICESYSKQLGVYPLRNSNNYVSAAFMVITTKCYFFRQAFAARRLFCAYCHADFIIPN